MVKRGESELAACWEEAVAADTSNLVKEGCESELVEHCDACCGAGCGAVQGDDREERVWSGTKLPNTLGGCALVGF